MQRTSTPGSTKDEEHLASVSVTSHYEAEVQITTRITIWTLDVIGQPDKHSDHFNLLQIDKVLCTQSVPYITFTFTSSVYVET